jgi:hypothetical protein
MQSSGPSLHPVQQGKGMLGPAYTTCAGWAVTGFSPTAKLTFFVTYCPKTSNATGFFAGRSEEEHV